MTPLISLSWGLSLAVKVGLAVWTLWTYAQQRGLESELVDGVQAIPRTAYNALWLGLDTLGGGQ